ncbi:MAG: RES family NAD+ phosphorylase [Tangfeifania sp.]
MIVYRLSKEKYCNDLSGKGAEISGGRWNSKGTAIIYTSGSRALCTAEVAVHTPIGMIPEDYFLVEIEFPDDIDIGEISVLQLSAHWNQFPHSQETQKIGDQFIGQNKFLVLKVPSAVVQGDSNYLINPQHADFPKVKIKKTELFSFDERLFRR